MLAARVLFVNDIVKLKIWFRSTAVFVNDVSVLDIFRYFN